MQELGVIEIITKDHTCQNGEAERVLPIIHRRLLEGNSIFIRKNNSLCFLTRLDNEKLEVHFYSVDSALLVVRAVKYFIEQMKSAGYKWMYINDFSDVNMKRILDMLKHFVEPSDIQSFKYMLNLRSK